MSISPETVSVVKIESKNFLLSISFLNELNLSFYKDKNASMYLELINSGYESKSFKKNVNIFILFSS